MKKTGLFVLLLASAAWAPNGSDANSFEAPQGLRRPASAFPPSACNATMLTCIAPDSSANRSCRTQLRAGACRPEHDEIHPWRHHLSRGTGYSAGASTRLCAPCATSTSMKCFPGKRTVERNRQPYEEVGRVKSLTPATKPRSARSSMPVTADRAIPQFHSQKSSP